MNNPFTTHANGTTQCQLAKPGTPCREEPDISANADEFTPYAEFCTGSDATPFSVCAQFSGSQIPPGWFGIGGTSLSSPLWAAIVADRDSFHRGRIGLANAWLYRLFNRAPILYFHDITGAGPDHDGQRVLPGDPRLRRGDRHRLAADGVADRPGRVTTRTTIG